MTLLQAGWTAATDPTSGVEYFTNEEGATQWEHPGFDAATEGWSAAADPSGATYYFHEDGRVQWERPPRQSTIIRALQRAVPQLAGSQTDGPRPPVPDRAVSLPFLRDWVAALREELGDATDALMSYNLIGRLAV